MRKVSDLQKQQQRQKQQFGLCSLITFLLIGGGILYGACNNSLKGSCPEVQKAGEVMMIIGGSLIGTVCCCFATCVGVSTVLECSSSD